MKNTPILALHFNTAYEIRHESEGDISSQHYDQTTTLYSTFLSSFNVVIFGLHQKMWTPANPGPEQKRCSTF